MPGHLARKLKFDTMVDSHKYSAIIEKMKDFQFNKDQNTHLVLSYKGPFDNKILSTLGSYLRLQISEMTPTGKKLFGIFMELTQNIALYSAESVRVNQDRRMGVGILLIYHYNDHFLLTTGNRIKHDDMTPLLDKSELINSLDRESLRKLKREHRKRPIGEKGGANIGLIKVALAATKPIHVEVTEIDTQYAFVSIAARVDKQ